MHMGGAWEGGGEEMGGARMNTEFEIQQIVHLNFTVLHYTYTPYPTASPSNRSYHY